jgi:hypothetical protein
MRPEQGGKNEGLISPSLTGDKCPSAPCASGQILEIRDGGLTLIDQTLQEFWQDIVASGCFENPADVLLLRVTDVVQKSDEGDSLSGLPR